MERPLRCLTAAKGWPGSIKAMALVESHPIAYEIEEFLFNLRDYILGLNLGRWDYMASLIHFNLDDPTGCFPIETRFRSTFRSFKDFGPSCQT